jgi:hypothetical protein
MKDKSVWIGTPHGGLIKSFYNFDKSFIKSYTRGGVMELRKWGWDIAKR